MQSRLLGQLSVYFENDGIRKRAKIREKWKARAYDRVFDEIEVLDKASAGKVIKKLQWLHNHLYSKAKMMVVGFQELSKLNVDDYNKIVGNHPAYANFEGELQRFIEEETLNLNSLIWKRIKIVACQLVEKGCEEILDEEGHVRLDIADMLGMTEPEDRIVMNDPDVTKRIVNSFAAEGIRQMNAILRDLEGNNKAKETVCGLRVFDGIEKGFEQALSDKIRPRIVINEEIVPEPREEDNSWTQRFFRPALSHSSTARIRPDVEFAALVRFGKNLLGLK